MCFKIRTIYLVVNILVMCFHFNDFRHIDIREQFLNRRKQTKINQGREFALDNNDSVKKVYLDGILHYKTSNDNTHTRWKRINEIEKDFRRLIAMDGVTYNYKRDVSWRTWRTVRYPSGKKNIICYKCNSEMETHNSCIGGVWTIEEKPPPCPYEFYSLVNDSTLCGANYTQYKDVSTACPSRIKFTDLTAICDNPIETAWRFRRVFNHSKKYENVICDGRDYCEIFTTYVISPEHVVFRIMNSSNNIIYSRIMKPGNSNYKCTEDCGIYNPFTKMVTKEAINNDDLMKMSLLSPSVKRKRENANYFDPKIKKKLIKKYKSSTRKYLAGNDLFHQFAKTTPASHCKEIGELYKEDEDINYEEYK